MQFWDLTPYMTGLIMAPLQNRRITLAYSLGMKVHQNTNDLIRADMRIAVLEATFNKIKGD